MPIQIIYTRMRIDSISITDSETERVAVNGKFSGVSGILPDIYNASVELSAPARALLTNFITRLKSDLEAELDIEID